MGRFHLCGLFATILMLVVTVLTIVSVASPWWTETGDSELEVEMGLWKYSRKKDPAVQDIDRTINEVCDDKSLAGNIEGEIDDQCSELKTLQTVAIVAIIAAAASTVFVFVSAVIISCDSWTRFAAALAAACSNCCILLAIILAGQIDVNEGFFAGDDVELSGEGFDCMIAALLLSLLGVALPCFTSRTDDTQVEEIKVDPEELGAKGLEDDPAPVMP